MLRLGSGSSCFRSVSSPHTTFCCAEGEYSSRRPRQCMLSCLDIICITERSDVNINQCKQCLNWNMRADQPCGAGSCSGECASFSGRERDVQQLHHCDDGLKVTSPLRQLFGLGPICSTSGAARQGEEIMLQQSTQQMVQQGQALLALTTGRFYSCILSVSSILEEHSRVSAWSSCLYKLFSRCILGQSTAKC